MLPNFVIIGAQKSGTTFLLRCLREHPQVFTPPGETRFFEDPEYSQTDITQFEALFSAVTDETAIGIKRPDYLAKPECPARIHAHLPDAKLIAVLRDPVQRAISAYFYQMQQSFIPVCSVEEGMQRVLAGDYAAKYPKSAEIIEYGFYHRHLLRYSELFPRERLLVLLFDDLIMNKAESLKEVFDFVGVDSEFVPDAIHRPKNPGVYSLSRLRLQRIPNAFLYTYNANQTKRYRKQNPTLLDKIVNKAVSAADGLLLTRLSSNEKPALDKGLANRLFHIYKAEIKGLEGFLNRSLDHWKTYG